jgi:hypothetical protein
LRDFMPIEFRIWPTVKPCPRDFVPFNDSKTNLEVLMIQSKD